MARSHVVVGIAAWVSAAPQLDGAPRVVLDPLTIGYLSHLGADLLTSSGLRLAWPSRRRCPLALCRTGSLRELMITAGAALWAGAEILGLHPMLGM